jgi:predicted nucleic acid-binding protein
VSFVLDASVAACWALDDEHHPIADAAIDRTRSEGMIVPSLWWFEMRNLLIVAERRKRSTVDKTNAFLDQLKRLDLFIDRSPGEEKIFHLARQHALTIYDASYLELAIRAAVPLATLDRKLAVAAQHEAVSLIV